MTRRPILAGLGIIALLVAVAIPALAAGPTASPPNKGDKTPKTEITLKGTIQSATDADGKAAYTIADGGKTYTLEAGPPWFWGDNHPLKPYVGKSVTVVGEVAEGSTDVDVVSVDGKALRAPGKPPWAGGWKVVGERHPGWSQEKADRFKAKFGDCFPPGQCREKPAESQAP
jgi:hypothetical protein